MPRFQFQNTAARLPAQATIESLRLTALVRCLVGHTVGEVERELILCSLSHFCGNRTCAAKVLGISVRTMRNKINEYAAEGMPVPAPGQNQTTTSTDTTTATITKPLSAAQ
jgi:two-component system response regulator FlrC